MPWLGATRSLLEQPSGAALVAWLGLGLTITLFVLKTLDVRWLRLGSRRRTALVFLLATALVHHEAAAAGLDDAGAVAVVATMAVAGAIAALPALRTNRPRAAAGPGPRWHLCSRWCAALKPLDPLAAPLASRAPPPAA